MDRTGRHEATEREFAKLYGGRPTAWFRAPGRVDLMGSHTDYNDGHVLTMTVDRDTWIAIRPRDDRRVAVASLNLPGRADFGLDAIEHDADVPWTDYVRGAASVLLAQGADLAGFDGLLHSTVPFGSGLSSSAAIEIATLLAFDAVSGLRHEPLELALLGQRVENEFVGVNCGILDQYTSVLGTADQALLLDCRELISQPVTIAPHLAVVICDTRAPRQLAGSEYDERRAQCEAGANHIGKTTPGVTALRDVSLELFEAHEAELPTDVARRCRFIIEEDQRVLDLASALPEGDPEMLSRLFDASYEGATRLFEIGASSMTAMHDAMAGAPGLIARRQAGAGFGGCLVAVVERGAVDAFSAHVERAYADATGIEPKIFAVDAAPGAGPVEFD
ncbi:MAG: galactokinase [Chloroflexota bacterium]|nr:galactokinase [Chloroflexota bacterium]